jgi:hypothetical protein
MGAEPALLGLARTIRFEDMHILTREEIARFGIDRRELAETPWTFENSARGVIGKVAVQTDGGDKSYHTSLWRLVCFNADQFELDFQRKALANASLAAVSMSNGGPKPLFLTPVRSKLPGSEFWSLRIDRASLQSLAGLAQFEVAETWQTPDGQRQPHTVKFSSEGLSGALDRLLATCPPAKSLASPSTATPLASRDSAVK